MTDRLRPSLLFESMPGRRTVAAGVWLVRGAGHDLEATAGATHLLEHLTLRRCGGRDSFGLAQLVDRLGGDVDAWTGAELMGVTVRTTPDALEEALGLVRDAVLAPTFDPDDVDLEKRVALAELELLRDDPEEMVSEALLSAAWGSHPLARPVIGTAESLRALTPEKLENRHREMVRPGGMVAAVAGDVDPQLVADSLKSLPLDNAPDLPQVEPLRWMGRRVSVGRQSADQVHARLAFPALAAGDPDVSVAAVLNRIIGVGASSRLFQRLREEEGLTYDISSGLVLRRPGGLLEIAWACSPEVFAEAWQLVLEELHRLPVSLGEEEVAVARQALLRGLDMDQDDPGARCSMEVGEFLDRGRLFDHVAVQRELADVSLSAVREMASWMLSVEKMASAVSGPEGVVELVA